MSYCRWSSMNWMCDVYVYEHCDGGWTTHVAGRKRSIPPIPDIPLRLLPRFGGEWSKEFRCVLYPSPWRKMCARLVSRVWGFWHRWVHTASLELIPLRDIGLPADGETFSDDTASECAERLVWLRDMGYTVPQYAIDALRQEEPEK